MAYGARAMDANPKAGLPSSSLLYRVGANVRSTRRGSLPHRVNGSCTTTLPKWVGRAVCAGKRLYVGHVSSHALRIQKTEGRGIELSRMGFPAKWAGGGGLCRAPAVT